MNIYVDKKKKEVTVLIPSDAFDISIKRHDHSDYFHFNCELTPQDNYREFYGFCFFFSDFGGRKHYPVKMTVEKEQPHIGSLIQKEVVIKYE